MITSKTQFYPSTVAPNPIEVDYWIDTKADPNGTVIKTWTGNEWQQITDTTTDDSEIKTILEALNSMPNRIITASPAYTPTATIVNAAAKYVQKSDLNYSNEMQGGNNVIPAATTTTAGVMTAADKTKLDNMEQSINTAVANLIGSAPETLDTLNELAAALGDDPNFATTMTNALATKVDKVDGKSLSTNDYTTEEKTKLAGIAANANNYTLPAATEEQLGGIKKVSMWQQFADSDDLATVITKLKSLCNKLQSAGILGSADPIV